MSSDPLFERARRERARIRAAVIVTLLLLAFSLGFLMLNPWSQAGPALVP